MELSEFQPCGESLPTQNTLIIYVATQNSPLNAKDLHGVSIPALRKLR